MGKAVKLRSNFVSPQTSPGITVKIVWSKEYHTGGQWAWNVKRWNLSLALTVIASASLLSARVFEHYKTRFYTLIK
jgi:hypothetical protein